jgi:hypothetical protein
VDAGLGAGDRPGDRLLLQPGAGRVGSVSANRKSLPLSSPIPVNQSSPSDGYGATEASTAMAVARSERSAAQARTYGLCPPASSAC